MTPDLARLRDAWLALPVKSPDAASLITLLSHRFHAYEISTSIHPPQDFLMDDEVREEDVWRLFTVDDPAVLRAIIDEEEASMAALHVADPMWENWRRILGNCEGEVESMPPVGFYLTTIQHSRGERVSVLLESADRQHIDGFKVYGLSHRLFAFMLAHVGWQKRAQHPSNPQGVRLGDLGDEDFRQYLVAAWEEGVLRLPDVTAS